METEQIALEYSIIKEEIKCIFKIVETKKNRNAKMY